MWTASIIKAIKEQGQAIVVVKYTQGQESVTKDYRLNGSDGIEEQYKAIIRNELGSFNKAYEFVDTLSPGVPDVTPKPIEPPPPPPAPSSEELAEAKFIKDLLLQRQMEAAIKLELMEPTDPAYVDQVMLVKSEFKPEYVELLGTV